MLIRVSEQQVLWSLPSRIGICGTVRVMHWPRATQLVGAEARTLPSPRVRSPGPGQVLPTCVILKVEITTLPTSQGCGFLKDRLKQ